MSGFGASVRHWRDTHDASAGPLEPQVDRVIRANRTVLLVLSENSVESDWVEHEANVAREATKASQRHVLCPVALGDAWRTCSWDRRLMDQVKKYNVLDFSNWMDSEAMNREFGRLLKGLKVFYGDAV